MSTNTFIMTNFVVVEISEKKLSENNVCEMIRSDIDEYMKLSVKPIRHIGKHVSVIDIGKTMKEWIDKHGKISPITVYSPHDTPSEAEFNTVVKAVVDEEILKRSLLQNFWAKISKEGYKSVNRLIENAMSFEKANDAENTRVWYNKDEKKFLFLEEKFDAPHNVGISEWDMATREVSLKTVPMVKSPELRIFSSSRVTLENVFLAKCLLHNQFKADKWEMISHGLFKKNNIFYSVERVSILQ